jgi:hypothetical protein
MQKVMHVNAVGEAAACSLLINAGLNQHKISFQFLVVAYILVYKQ